MMQTQQHTVGTFCFIESGSANVDLSHRFYRGVLGWEPDVHAFPDGGSYTRFLIHGLPVAGASSVETEHLDRLPAHWWPFVSVANLNAVLERAVALGAVPLGDVVDVQGEFSAAEFRDPAGAVCGLWQAGAHIGARFTGEAGALSWTDLSTPDPDKAVEFYGELFGWAPRSQEPGSRSYEFFTLDGAVVAGLSRSDSEDASWWRPHVGVHDLDAALASVSELGGDVGDDVRGTADLGRRAVIEDPNGIQLMLIELST